MEKSDQINEIAGALAKAQGVVKGASKDATNPHFRSKYADLASVWDACRAALSENGIAVVQGPSSNDDGSVSVVTMLCHSSGQWMSETLSVKPVKADAQGIGSAITYLRRYGLAAMVGVAPDDDDDDDDGEAAVNGTGASSVGKQRQSRTDSGEEDTSRTAAENDAKLIKRHIQTCTDSQELDTFFAGIGYVTVGDIKPHSRLGVIKGVSATGYQHLVKLYTEKRAALENPQTQDRAA